MSKRAGSASDSEGSSSKKAKSGTTTPNSGDEFGSIMTPSSNPLDDSQSLESKETTIKRHIGRIAGEIVATTLGQGAIFEKIHARAGTNVSGGEGNHITASVVLNEIIYNFFEDKNYDQVIAELPILLDSLGIDQSNKSSIEDVLKLQKDFLDQGHLALSKERRYDLTQDLRQTRFIAEELREKGIDIGKITEASGLSLDSQRRLKDLFDPEKTFQEEQILEVREGLKYARRAANAGIITAVSEEMVYILNHQKELPSALPSQRDSDGCHSRDENETMKNLRLFNALYGLAKNCEKKEDTERQSLLTQFSEDVKSIMRYSNPNISSQKTIDESFNKFMKNFFEGEEFCSKKPTEIDVAWLDQVSAALSDNAKYPQKLGEYFNNLYDFGYVKHKYEHDSQHDEQILYQSSARHICYMLSAFKNLKSLSKEILESVKDKFFDEILKPVLHHEEGGRRIWDSKGQGWEDMEISREGDKLDRSYLKQSVEKYIDANHRFSLKAIDRNAFVGGGRS